jgi:hypothetical protein
MAITERLTNAKAQSSNQDPKENAELTLDFAV